MATYEVKHEDGRVTTVNSDSGDEARIKTQANHQDLTRVLHRRAVGYSPKRDNWQGPEHPSMAVSVTKVKD